MQLKKVLIS